MAATTYASIRSMSAGFKSTLSNMEFPFPFDVDNTSMIILVDLEDDLGDILAANPAKLALVIGMDEDKPTICVLGADSSGDVLSSHVSGSLAGQQAWPSPKNIKFVDDTEYDAFFVAPS